MLSINILEALNFSKSTIPVSLFTSHNKNCAFIKDNMFVDATKLIFGIIATIFFISNERISCC